MTTCPGWNQQRTTLLMRPQWLRWELHLAHSNASNFRGSITYSEAGKQIEWLNGPDFLFGTCKYMTSILQWVLQNTTILHVHVEVHQQTQLSEGSFFWGINLFWGKSLNNATLGMQTWIVHVVLDSYLLLNRMGSPLGKSPAFFLAPTLVLIMS